MELLFREGRPKGRRGAVLVTGAFEGLKGVEEQEKALLKALGFQGKLGETAVLPKARTFKAVVFTGLGAKKNLKPDSLRLATAKGLFRALKLKAKELLFEDVASEVLGEKAVKAMAEGIALGAYRFDRYRSDGESEPERAFIFGEGRFATAFEEGRKLAEVNNFVRDLVNEPGNVLNPETLSRVATELAKECGFECRVFDRRELEERKMVGILSVGSGSSVPPRFVHIACIPESPKMRVVLVGKGVTFDSGGLNLKPEQFMKTMKADKAGACVVLGVVKALKELSLSVELHALLPLVENMPGGSAYRPDDILLYRNRRSVEIHSTDAEGRLIMADALIYGSELEPDVMIDVATLTGACVVALGRYTSGLFTRDERLATTLLSVSSETGEKLWRLPLDEDLKGDIKGTCADLRNVGKTRYGGAITAGLFLENFVDEKKVKSWAHLDIAGPAYLEEEWKYYAPGATGQPVRTLVEFLLRS